MPACWPSARHAAAPQPHSCRLSPLAPPSLAHCAGTSLRYKPGFIAGGGLGVEHDCPPSRAIGYFLEPLSLVALWGKKPLTAVLRGVTNDTTDCGVDVFRTVTFPLLRKLTGAEDGFELKVGWAGGWVALRGANVRCGLRDALPG